MNENVILLHCVIFGKFDTTYNITFPNFTTVFSCLLEIILGLR